MTFRTISYKMFKADARKYRLFILCNLISIAILYAFISISKNGQFMNYSIVDPMISSNIYAPTFLLIVFTFIFIPYTQSSFIKARQKDYGILLTLGMTENEVRNSVLIENLILCIIYLIGGLALGTFLSVFFLAFIRNVIGIDGINITISIVSYKVTTLYVMGIFLASLFVNLIGIIKSTIYEKIKYTEKAEIGRHYSIKLCIAGIALTIASFIIMIAYFRINSNVWLLSVIACILGSVLIYFNGEALIELFQNKYYKKYVKNIFAFSDIKYYYGKNKKIFFATTWIFFTIMFFIMFGLAAFPSLTNNSIAYHPFHMAYTEIKGSFKSLGDDEIKLIAKNNSNSVTLNDSITYVRNNAFTIICIDDINRIMNKNYQIKPNSFIYVHPYYANDGYEHDTDTNISNISIGAHKDTKKLIKKDTIIDPLFGKVNCISDKIFLVNKNDYEWITLYGYDYNIKGTLHFYNFDNWRSSDKIVNEVWNKLAEKNNIEKNDRFYKISSRIEAYNTALKSAGFLIFVFIYVSLLLYFSAIIMIHFKLRMEYEDEKKKYYSLYRIGIKETEIKKMVSQKILIVYSIPFLYAIIINIAYGYYTNSSYGYGVIGVLCALATSLAFSIMHFVVYILYFRTYYKTVISEISSKSG